MDVTWPEELPFQVALGWKPNSEIAEDFALSDQEFKRIYAQPAFKEQVRGYKLRITEEGIGTKLLAQVASGKAIEKMMKLANDIGVAGAVRLDALKTVLRIAGTDPDKAENTGDAFSAGGMLLQILPPTAPRAPEPVLVGVEAPTETIDTGWLEVSAPEPVEDDGND
jgi:hypothetical protein